MSVIKNRSTLVLLVFILSGLVVGGLIGELTRGIDSLWWLSYSQEFGMSNPVELDLSILKLTFAIKFKINLVSILGMLSAIWIYRKV